MVIGRQGAPLSHFQARTAMLQAWTFCSSFSGGFSEMGIYHQLTQEDTANSPLSLTCPNSAITLARE